MSLFVPPRIPPPDPASDLPEPIASAFTVAASRRTVSERLVVVALAALGCDAYPDQVASLTGLSATLAESTLRRLAKTSPHVTRQAWLDSDERKRVAYRFHPTTGTVVDDDDA